MTDQNRKPKILVIDDEADLLAILSSMAEELLFHYRSSDAQTAEILIGVQVSPGQESSFEAVTQSLEAEEFQCTDLSAHEGEMEGLRLLVGGD